MSQDESNDFQGMGNPDGQVPLPTGDADVAISNTGQRVVAILVVLILLGGAGAGVYWWNGQKEQIARHEAVRTAFESVHRTGYAAFWSKSQIDVKAMKTNTDFEARMHQILTDNPVRYVKHLEEQALPILTKSLPEYKKIEAPSEYADKVQAVAKAAEDLQVAWKGFATEVARYKPFLEAKAKLSEHGDAWFGAQQSDDAKYATKAQKYYSVLHCILKDKNIAEIVPNEVSNAVQDACLSDKPAWFRRVGLECLPAMLGDASEADKADYEKTVAAFRKSDAERLDHNSVFGVESCLDDTRAALEAELIESLAKAWANYIVAQNGLLDVIEAKLKELR